MQVSLDGGLTWQEANEGVRVIYDDLSVTYFSEGEVDTQLLVNCTHEGLILDAIETKKGEVAGTSSEMAQEIVDRLVGT